MLPLQVITSFLAGGAFVAFLSIWAEKSSTKMAGIVISLPSTIAISFTFIGLVTSPETIKEVVPTAIFTMGGVITFIAAYLYTSKFKNKWICLAAAIPAWLLFAIPSAFLKFNTLLIPIITYLIMGLFGFYFLTIRPKIEGKPTKTKYSTNEKLIRSLLAGTVIASAVLLSKLSGPILGGVLSAFPSTYTSSLFIYHRKHDSNFLFRIFKSSPLGLFPMLAFMLTSYFTFPAYGIIIGLLTAYISSIIVFLIISKCTQKEAQN